MYVLRPYFDRVWTSAMESAKFLSILHNKGKLFYFREEEKLWNLIICGEPSHKFVERISSRICQVSFSNLNDHSNLNELCTVFVMLWLRWFYFRQKGIKCAFWSQNITRQSCKLQILDIQENTQLDNHLPEIKLSIITHMIIIYTPAMKLGGFTGIILSVRL